MHVPLLKGKTSSILEGTTNAGVVKIKILADVNYLEFTLIVTIFSFIEVNTQI